MEQILCCGSGHFRNGKVYVITKDEIDVDRTFRLKLKDNNFIISLSGIIVRKEFLDNLGAFLYGCKFNEKNNQLGKYIAKKQNELLRKKTSRYSSPPAREKRNPSEVELTDNRL
jgi:hypothetical protein